MRRKIHLECALAGLRQRRVLIIPDRDHVGNVKMIPFGPDAKNLDAAREVFHFRSRIEDIDRDRVTSRRLEIVADSLMKHTNYVRRFAISHSKSERPVSIGFRMVFLLHRVGKAKQNHLISSGDLAERPILRYPRDDVRRKHWESTNNRGDHAEEQFTDTPRPTYTALTHHRTLFIDDR